MATVIKRDGTEERFDNEKLINSMRKAGLDEATASEIAEGVSFEIRDVSSGLSASLYRIASFSASSRQLMSFTSWKSSGA